MMMIELYYCNSCKQRFAYDKQVLNCCVCGKPLTKGE